MEMIRSILGRGMSGQGMPQHLLLNQNLIPLPNIPLPSQSAFGLRLNKPLRLGQGDGQIGLDRE